MEFTGLIATLKGVEVSVGRGECYNHGWLTRRTFALTGGQA